MRTALLALLALTPALAQAQFPIRVPLEDNEFAVANPPRVERDFARINARHKILVAVLGAGVDYNHPLLSDSFHFDLENGQAVGLGYDFVGEDRWPSYRLFDTSRLGFDRQLPEKKREIEETSSREKWEESRADEIAKFSCITHSLIKSQPGLGVYSPSERNFMSEGQIPNTTGVSGVIAGGVPEIGVIPYRTGPFARNQQESKDEGLFSRSIEMENVRKAIDSAADRGARIVFLPSIHFDSRPDDTASQVSRNGLARFMKKKALFAEQYLRLMNAHPEMVFVSMVAPTHGWTDDVSLIQYPCGLPAKNLVCAGPLNDRDVLEPNYKIPVNEEARLLFTRPTEKDVLTPSDECARLTAVLINFLASEEEEDSNNQPLGQACTYNKATGKWSPKAASRALEAVLDETLQSCSGSKNWTGESDLSPTELSAAQITRVVAQTWLSHPEISKGAALLDLVFEKDAKCERAGALNQCRIKTDAPDWAAAIRSRRPAPVAPQKRLP